MRGVPPRIFSIQPPDQSFENVLNPATTLGAHDAARLFASADSSVTPPSGVIFNNISPYNILIRYIIV